MIINYLCIRKVFESKYKGNKLSFLRDMKFHNCLYVIAEQFTVADKLNAFVIELMSEFMTILETRMLLEKNLSEAALLVRAVDRFYRRIQGKFIYLSLL